MNDAPVAVEQSAIQMMESASVNQQVKTAKQYPRDMAKVKKRIVDIACLDESTAAECHYCIPRAGKEIVGPSVRLAEIVASQYGNLRTYAYIVDTGQKFVTAECVAYDMENNFAHKHQVRRRITDKNGNRYNDDLIVVTSNAACSIAFREAVFKIAPRAIVKAAYEAALRFSTGDEDKLPERRKKMMARFAEFGVTETMLLQLLGRASVDEIGVSDLQKCVGIWTALSDGDISVRETFGSQKSPKKTTPAPVTQPAPVPPKTDFAPPGQEEVNDEAAPPVEDTKAEKKKRGRPAGSKNKSKEEAAAPPGEERKVAAPSGQSPQQEYETLLLQLETSGKGEQLSAVMTTSVQTLNKTIDEFTGEDYAHVNAELRKVLADEA